MFKSIVIFLFFGETNVKAPNTPQQKLSLRFLDIYTSQAYCPLDQIQDDRKDLILKEMLSLKLDSYSNLLYPDTTFKVGQDEEGEYILSIETTEELNENNSQEVLTTD